MSKCHWLEAFCCHLIPPLEICHLNTKQKLHAEANPLLSHSIQFLSSFKAFVFFTVFHKTGLTTPSSSSSSSSFEPESTSCGFSFCATNSSSGMGRASASFFSPAALQHIPQQVLLPQFCVSLKVRHMKG